MAKNFALLIKEEIVKRFSSVVSEEIRQHNLAIQRSNADIKSMQAELDSYKLQIKKLYSENLKLHEETREQFRKEKESLESVFSSQRDFVNGISAKIENYILDFVDVASTLCKRSDHENCKDELLNKIHNLSLKIQQDKKDIDEQIARSSFENRKNIDHYSDEFRTSLSDMNKAITLTNNTANTDRIDSVGILRELQIHKKSVFISEKKIENLYTLIERLTKRIDS